MPADAADYPPEVIHLHSTLARLAAVSEVCSGIQALEGVGAEELSLSTYAQLPHGALRRTAGALPGETLVQVEFQVEPTAEGWRSVEFLAWFVRDAARGSLPLQLRPFALPPTVGERVQLGRTLRFHLDYFFLDTPGEIDSILQALDGLAADLASAIDLYEGSLHQRGGPSLLRAV